jgi:hypothetical protein
MADHHGEAEFQATVLDSASLAILDKFTVI